MPDSNEKPPVRPIFRKLAWIPAVVSFLCALVAVTGFMGADNRLWMMLIFLFCGLVFMTIALMGGTPVSAGAATVNLVIGMICLLALIGGLEQLNDPSFVKRLLGGFVVITGAAGVIANLMAYRDHRKQAKQ